MGRKFLRRTGAKWQAARANPAQDIVIVPAKREYRRRPWRNDGLLVPLDPVEWTKLSYLTSVRLYHRPLTPREAAQREALRLRFVACGVANSADTFGLGKGDKPAERAR